jgi:hypothetical protein
MIPFRAKPNVKRDELAKAQKAAWLPLSKFRGSGEKTLQEMYDVTNDLKKQGATNKDIHDLTVPFAGEKESGVQLNAAGQPGFELNTKGTALTPYALNMLKGFQGWGGSTGPETLDRLFRADTLYDYMPQLKKVETRLNQPYDDQTDFLPGGGYDSPAVKGGRGTPAGRIEVFGAPGVDPEDISNPDSLYKSVMHEVEHPIQFLTGTPGGGFPDDEIMQQFFQSQMQPHANQIRIKAETAREQYARDYAAREGGTPEAYAAGRAQWEQTDPENALLLKQAEHIGGAPGRAKEGRMATAPAGPLAQYKSLTGEQMAEGASQRSEWGTEQRRDNPIFEPRGLHRLSPALQAIRWGPGQFALPKVDWSLK